MRNRVVRAAAAGITLLCAVSPLLLAQLPQWPTLATLNACRAGLTGRVVVIKDGQDAADCSVGGATGTDAHAVVCVCDQDGAGGYVWQPVGEGAGGGGGGAPSGPAGGDLTGTYPNPTVAANAVALGTDTTGGYAASVSEAGPATTATALAANGANCSAGSFPLGVDASGASETCTSLPTTITGTSNQIAASASTGAITLSIPSSPTLPGTTTGTFSGPLTGNVTGNLTGAVTGNASTASALAANGANCSAGSYALGVDASGAAEGCTVAATGTLGGSTGGTDRAVLIANGTGGSTAQASTVLIDSNNDIILPASRRISGADNYVRIYPSSAGGDTGNGFNIGPGNSSDSRIEGSSGNAGAPLIFARAGSSTLPVYSYSSDTDTGTARSAADTLSIITGGSEAVKISGLDVTLGWVRGAGTCSVASDQTNATTGFQTAACYRTTSGSVAIALRNGKTYAFKCELFLSDSVALDGAKIDFGGGTATASNFRAQVTAFDASLALSSQVTSLTAPASASTFTGDGAFEVHGTLTASADGSFQPRFAQVAHTTGTLTLAQGSHCLVWDVTP